MDLQPTNFKQISNIFACRRPGGRPRPAHCAARSGPARPAGPARPPAPRRPRHAASPTPRAPAHGRGGCVSVSARDAPVNKGPGVRPARPAPAATAAALTLSAPRRAGQAAAPLFPAIAGPPRPWPSAGFPNLPGAGF